ncbi:hypothetical protein GWI33_008432 [Rhynchophorus ferrugineus]|uniref:DNA helicase n=1 Tax=Rhynchophorus ferrugineus TaxID=354439 RepID=A0A834ICW4_RHYFE|nr:hypothetical protein GWI33_008432 [Rhynchophorus ferrugineus]
MSGRRRRSNIGSSSVNARRVRSQRDEESSTEREARLSQLRDRYRVERERESSIEREVRRSRDRDRHSVQRDRESSVEREARLSQPRDRYRADRERESSVEREVRRSRDRDRHRIQRARESSARVTNSWVNKENSAINYDPSISYKDDRIVSIGVVYNTYQAACKTMGLLEDDSHWENTLSEAAVCSSATSLRYLFAVIVAFCQVADSVNLWNKFQENMASDILNQRRRELNSDDIQYDQHIFDEALFELNKVLQLLSGKSIKDFGLPMPANTTSSDLTNSAEYTREISYDQTRLLQNIAQDEPRLNIDQKKVFTALLSTIDNNEGKLFFLDAPVEMLLKVGNGELTQSEGRINLENLCVLIDNIQELVNKVYPDIDDISYKTISWFKERAILSPTNEQVDKVLSITNTHQAVNTKYTTSSSKSKTKLHEGLPQPPTDAGTPRTSIVLTHRLTRPNYMKGKYLKAFTCKTAGYQSNAQLIKTVTKPDEYLDGLKSTPALFFSDKSTISTPPLPLNEPPEKWKIKEKLPEVSLRVQDGGVSITRTANQDDDQAR